jgi:hypothetical protein
MNTFKTIKGTELPLMELKGKPYLQVAHRLVWFREEHPNWSIETEVKTGDKGCLSKAIIKDETGRIIATGHKSETLSDFKDYIEKSETGAIGRALALCGYGTQFAPDLDEEQRIVDSPIQRQIKQSAPLDAAPKVSPSPNVSTAQVVKAPVQVQTTVPGKAAPVLKPQPVVHQAPVTFSPTAGSGITTEQIGSINTLVAGLGLSQDQLRDLSVRLFNVSLIRSLSKPQGDILARELRTMSNPPNQNSFQEQQAQFMDNSDIPF